MFFMRKINIHYGECTLKKNISKERIINFPKNILLNLINYFSNHRYYKIPSQSEELLEFIYDDWKIPKNLKMKKSIYQKKFILEKV